MPWQLSSCVSLRYRFFLCTPAAIKRRKGKNSVAALCHRGNCYTLLHLCPRHDEWSNHLLPFRIVHVRLRTLWRFRQKAAKVDDRQWKQEICQFYWVPGRAESKLGGYMADNKPTSTWMIARKGNGHLLYRVVQLVISSGCLIWWVGLGDCQVWRFGTFGDWRNR